MKKNIILFLFSIATLFTAYSQDKGPGGKGLFDLEKYKAQKMAYLIQEVGITPEESAQLFPLYNEMQAKRFKLMMTSRSKARAINKNQNASDADCLSVIDEMLDNQIEDAKIEKAYYQRFKTILSPQKLLKLKRADFHFAREILKKNDQRDSKPNQNK